MRVALLSQDVNPTSGWGTLTYELCQQFERRDDVDFELFVPPAGAPDGPMAFADKVSATLPNWTGGFGRRPNRLLPYLRPQAPARTFDVVHTLIEFPYAITASRWARKLGVPFVVMTQGTYGVAPLTKWMDRFLYKPALERAAAVTAPSAYTAEAMHTVGRLNRDVTVIHNPVNYERFQASYDTDAVRDRYGIPRDARIVLGVGALKARKGFDVLIDSFKAVAEAIDDAYLVIVGGGGQESELGAQLRERGLEGRAQLVGKVKDDELTAFYQTCEVYSHLPVNTAYNFEGFGIVYLEAGACAKPVVASNSGGVADAVIDGETGFLVPEWDADAAGQAILRLLRDSALAAKMGAAGQAYAAKHTWAWYANEMVELYQTATGAATERSANR